MPKKPAIGQAGLILGIGAVGLGLVLLPGFFQRREAEAEAEAKAKAEEGGQGPVPTPLPKVAPRAEEPAPTPKKDEKSKAGLRANRLPTLSVTTRAPSSSTGYDFELDYGINGIASRNRGVGSHMKAGAVDVWSAREIFVDADWEIQNLTNERIPFDFRLKLRQTKDWKWYKSLVAIGWGNAFARDKTVFEYTPERGIREDSFFDAFKVGVKTSHGARRGRQPQRGTIAARGKEKVRMGLVLPGPAQSKELRKFWEAGPMFNFLVEVYQGGMRFAEHEFKGAFTTTVERPVLRALPQTRGVDSPRLTIRGR